MPIGPPTASVIICAYTRARWNLLRSAIASVQRQTLPPLEVIVVVDHNRQLLELTRTHVEGVCVLESTGVPGLSGARNTGVTAARGQVVAFLDDDADADPEWLANLLAPYVDPRIAGVGGLIEPAWQSRRPAWFPSEFQWVLGCSYRGLPVTSAPVRNLIGANMSLRRSVFETAGGFRSDLGHSDKGPGGDEETELCIRVRRHHPEAMFVYEPTARVRHHVPAERATWRYFLTRCAAEGRAKARVARLVGSARGLASERAYVARTLPQGVARGLADVLIGGDIAGACRAAAIIAGLGVTTAAYMRGA